MRTRLAPLLMVSVVLLASSTPSGPSLTLLDPESSPAQIESLLPEQILSVIRSPDAVSAVDPFVPPVLITAEDLKSPVAGPSWVETPVVLSAAPSRILWKREMA